MDIQKTARWLIAGLALLGCQAVQAVTTLSITGTLTKNVCTFEQENTVQDVQLASKSVRYFVSNRRTEVTPFIIGINNCPDDVRGKVVSLTFTATQTRVIDGKTMLETTGGTGLAIGLLTESGQPIEPGKAVDAGLMVNTGDNTKNKFTFGAYAEADGPVQPGDYSATATVEMAFN